MNTLINTQSPLMVAVAQGLTTLTDYAPGCDVDVPDAQLASNDTAIAAAAAAAKAADVAVLFLGICGNRDLPGGTSVLPHLPASSCGRFFEAEEADRASIEVPPVQRRLFDAVIASQPATVVVLVNGGSLGGVAELGKRSAALIESFYGGEMAGPAIVSVLSGAYNPGGKLPYTLYPNSIMDR
jgi:beta-glucosidase